MPYLRIITKKVIKSRVISKTRSKSTLYYALSEVGFRGDEIISQGYEEFRIYKATIRDVLNSLHIKDPAAEIKDTGYTYGDIETILKTALELSPENNLSVEFQWE